MLPEEALLSPVFPVYMEVSIKGLTEFWFTSSEPVLPRGQCYPAAVSHQKDRTAPAYSTVSDKDVGSGGVG